MRHIRQRAASALLADWQLAPHRRGAAVHPFLEWLAPTGALALQLQWPSPAPAGRALNRASRIATKAKQGTVRACCCLVWLPAVRCTMQARRTQ